MAGPTPLTPVLVVIASVIAPIPVMAHPTDRDRGRWLLQRVCMTGSASITSPAR